MSQHTPGPWRLMREISNGEDRLVVTGEDSDFVVASINEMFSPNHPEVLANAELIVRAVNCHDDLLAALKDLAACVEQYRSIGVLAPWDKALKDARAAIAKATGA